MAKTKVFTITVQNQPGAVAAIAKALGSAKVNVLALLGTAQGATGQEVWSSSMPRGTLSSANIRDGLRCGDCRTRTNSW